MKHEVDTTRLLETAIRKYGKERTLLRRDILFEEGQPAKFMHYVVSGKIAEKQITGDRNVIVSFSNSEEIVGFGSFEQETYRTTAIAAVDTTLIYLSGRAFTRVTEKHLQQISYIMNNLIGRAEQQRNLIVNGTASQRVAGALLDYMEIDENSWKVFATQEELGERALADRTTINRELRKFKEKRLIANRPIHVHSPILIYEPQLLQDKIDQPSGWV